MSNTTLIVRESYRVPDDLLDQYNKKVEDARQWLAEECRKRGVVPDIQYSISDPERRYYPTQSPSTQNAGKRS